MSNASLARRRTSTRASCFAFSAVLLLSASAAATSVQLPNECGSASEFEREVDARLPPNVPRPAPEVWIEQRGREYHLRLQLEQESREFRHADCRELLRVAVVVTVAMSLSHAEPQPPPVPAPSGSASPASGERSQSLEVPAASPALSEPGPPWALGVSGASGLNFGMAPRPVLELELEGRALRGAFGVALRARYRAPGADQDQNERGVRVSSWGAQAAFIARPHRMVEASIGVSAYRLAGAGLGAVSQRDDAVWSAGPALGLTLIPLQRHGTWVGVGGELHLDLVQPEFQILNYTTVFRVPLFSGSAFLRVGHLFN